MGSSASSASVTRATSSGRFRSCSGRSSRWAFVRRRRLASCAWRLTTTTLSRRWRPTWRSRSASWRGTGWVEPAAFRGSRLSRRRRARSWSGIAGTRRARSCGGSSTATRSRSNGSRPTRPTRRISGAASCRPKPTGRRFASSAARPWSGRVRAGWPSCSASGQSPPPGNTTPWSWAPVPRASPRRSTGHRRACARSSSNARRRGARPAPPRASRTTSAFPRACQATSWPAEPSSRRGGSGPRSSLPARSPESTRQRAKCTSTRATSCARRRSFSRAG